MRDLKSTLLYIYIVDLSNIVKYTNIIASGHERKKNLCSSSQHQ